MCTSNHDDGEGGGEACLAHHPPALTPLLLYIKSNQWYNSPAPPPRLHESQLALSSSLNKITSHFPHRDYHRHHPNSIINNNNKTKTKKNQNHFHFSHTAGANQRSFGFSRSHPIGVHPSQLENHVLYLYMLDRSPHAVSCKGGTSHTCTGGSREWKVGVYGFGVCVS